MKDAPTHRLYADQWGEAGYFLVDGKVYSYEIDRKEQSDALIGSWTVSDFLESSASDEVKDWLRAVV